MEDILLSLVIAIVFSVVMIFFIIIADKIIMKYKLKHTKYYLQKGYVGNAILWWKKGGHGYTTEFNEAGKFSKEQALVAIKDPKHKAWSCYHIDTTRKAHKHTIDTQYLDFKFLLKKENNR